MIFRRNHWKIHEKLFGWTTEVILHNMLEKSLERSSMRNAKSIWRGIPGRILDIFSRIIPEVFFEEIPRVNVDEFLKQSIYKFLNGKLEKGRRNWCRMIFFVLKKTPVGNFGRSPMVSTGEIKVIKKNAMLLNIADQGNLQTEFSSAGYRVNFLKIKFIILNETHTTIWRSKRARCGPHTPHPLAMLLA